MHYKVSPVKLWCIFMCNWHIEQEKLKFLKITILFVCLFSILSHLFCLHKKMCCIKCGLSFRRTFYRKIQLKISIFGLLNSLLVCLNYSICYFDTGAF